MQYPLYYLDSFAPDGAFASAESEVLWDQCLRTKYPLRTWQKAIRANDFPERNPEKQESRKD